MLIAPPPAAGSSSYSRHLFDQRKLVFSSQGPGISYTAAEGEVLRDDKTRPQSSLAVTQLPLRAKVVKAHLYWSGEVLPVGAADTGVELILPDGRSVTVYAEQARSRLEGGLAYTCRAEVTRHVRSAGLYRLQGLDVDPIRGKSGRPGSVLGWWALVILYRVPGLSSTARVAVYDPLGEGSGLAPDEGGVTEEVGPVLIVEKRPADALFHLKRAGRIAAGKKRSGALWHALAALRKSPGLTFAYLLGVARGHFLVGFGLGRDLLKGVLAKAGSALAAFFILYAVAINAAYLILTLIALCVTRKYLERERKMHGEPFLRAHPMPPVSVLIAAYNEEGNVVRTVRSALDQEHPRHEVIVVNDGSTDRTLEVLVREFELEEHPSALGAVGALPAQAVRTIYRSRRWPNLRVIDKENSGKADSLNAGLNLSRCPFFCTVDADTLLEPDALVRLCGPLLEKPEETAGATGMVRLRNGCTVRDGFLVRRDLPKSFLGSIQALEYLRAYSIGRIAWNARNAQTIVSGTFSLYRKDWVVRLGGYHRYAIGEDVDLNLRLHKFLLESGRRYRMPYVLSARCLTQAPEDLRSLARQRARWHQGLAAAVRLNAGMLFRRKYGRVGTAALPFYALLELPAPVLELFGYVVMPLFALFGLLDAGAMWTLLGLVWFYGSGLSALAVLFDGKFFGFYGRRAYRRLLLLSVAEGFGFHQMTVFWRLRGMLRDLRKVHTEEMGWRSPVRLQAA